MLVERPQLLRGQHMQYSMVVKFTQVERELPPLPTAAVAVVKKILLGPVGAPGRCEILGKRRLVIPRVSQGEAALARDKCNSGALQVGERGSVFLAPPDPREVGAVCQFAFLAITLPWRDRHSLRIAQ
eukprot:7629830-Pyramimonas_sp.AAC.1